MRTLRIALHRAHFNAMTLQLFSFGTTLAIPHCGTGPMEATMKIVLVAFAAAVQRRCSTRGHPIKLGAPCVEALACQDVRISLLSSLGGFAAEGDWPPSLASEESE